LHDKDVKAMRSIFQATFWAFLVLMAVGCTQQPGADQGSTADTETSTSDDAGNAGNASNVGNITQSDTPEAATREFLEAIRKGNDKRATDMLSAVAQQKTAALNRRVMPQASDTAQYTIGKVEFVGKDGARVACTWTDLNENSQPDSTEAIWVLRCEANGWRIAGVAYVLFRGEPPLLLNFEDPEDMLRRLQWAREEKRSREKKEHAALQAKEEENSKKSVRR
jgi:hypothetical protein